VTGFIFAALVVIIKQTDIVLRWCEDLLAIYKELGRVMA
jgi:hypothetical protein